MFHHNCFQFSGPKVYNSKNKGSVYKVNGNSMEINVFVGKVYLEKQ